LIPGAQLKVVDRDKVWLIPTSQLGTCTQSRQHNVDNLKKGCSNDPDD
jgi:hypothetical protein